MGDRGKDHCGRWLALIGRRRDHARECPAGRRRSVQGMGLGRSLRLAMTASQEPGIKGAVPVAGPTSSSIFALAAARKRKAGLCSGTNSLRERPGRSLHPSWQALLSSQRVRDRRLPPDVRVALYRTKSNFVIASRTSKAASESVLRSAWTRRIGSDASASTMVTCRNGCPS